MRKFLEAEEPTWSRLWEKLRKGCFSKVSEITSLQRTAQKKISLLIIAYKQEREARDALAFVMSIVGFCMKKKFAMYCLNVSGAFDRVHLEWLFFLVNCLYSVCSFQQIVGPNLDNFPPVAHCGTLYFF